MELMRRFCDPFSHRFRAGVPFVEDGNASATDLRAAIRVFDAMSIANTDSPLRLPPIGKAFDVLWKPIAKWQDMPPAEYQTDSDINGCVYCSGWGFLGPLTECAACDGSGQKVSEKDWNEWGEQAFDECEHCIDGYRSDRRCGFCKGKPFAKGHGGTMQLAEELKINAIYHHLLSMLPGARWSISRGYEHAISGISRGPVCLVEFEGGQAMVMGIAK